jgi:hypothetical protein
MSAAVQTPDLDVVQHPTLGTLKFPKDMPYEERNESIQRTLLSRPDLQAPPGVPKPPETGELDPRLPSYEQASKEAQDKIGQAATMAAGGGGLEKIGQEALPVIGKPILRGVGKVASAVGDAASGDIAGAISPRIPHIGRMVGKVGRIASAIGEEKPVFPGAHLPEAPPTYPGAPLPEHPGTFPGAHLPENPGTFPGAHLPEHPGTFPGAPLPAAPPAEVLQARPISTGAQSTPPSPASGLRGIKVRPAGPPGGFAEQMSDNIAQDQARAQAEGMDNQQTDQLERERLEARMPRHSDRVVPIRSAVETKEAVPPTPADADLEDLGKKSLAKIKADRARKSQSKD